MKRYLLFSLILLLAACNALGEPSAEEIVRRAEAAMDNLEQAHAIIEVEISREGEVMRLVGEGWMDGEQKRGVVLEASEAKLVGTLALSDGERGWLYHPEHDKALTGDTEEMKAYREEEANEMPAEFDFNSLTEMVDELLRITEQDLVGSEAIAGLDTWHLRLTPNSEAPPELNVVGGVVDLWISQKYDLPLKVAYTGSSLGEGHVTVLEYEAEPELADELFTFTPPDGVEVIDVSTLLPERMTLIEAKEQAAFSLLSTAADTAEAALMDVYRVKDAYVQEFDGTLGAWKLMQSAKMPAKDKIGKPDKESDKVELEAVTVRGALGQLASNAEKGWTMLSWEEEGILRLLSGKISPERAVELAEMLE